ncbi:MAG: hypothetical protein WDM96_06830 [Lacunisphaera sp.]
MKRLLVVLFLSCLILAPTHADCSANPWTSSPSQAGKSAEPLEPGQTPPPFPVLKYVPADGRNAAILLSLLPAKTSSFEVTDLASLTRFNLMAAEPYLPSPTARPPLIALKVPGGIGGYIVNEDPALVGKPVPPNEYRIAATGTLLLDGKYLVNCTIFYDEKDSADFKEALRILLSASVHTASQTI